MKDKPNTYYAHSLEGQPTKKWQPLDEHLRNVADTNRIQVNKFMRILK